MFKNILLPVDLGDETFPVKALSVAVAISQSNAATLHLLSVVPGYGMSIVAQYFPKDYEEKAQAESLRRLQEIIAEKVPADVTARSIVATGNVYEEIVRVAGDANCDLVVMASNRPGLERYLLGPNAAKVVRHANCSVFVVRD